MGGAREHGPKPLGTRGPAGLEGGRGIAREGPDSASAALCRWQRVGRPPPPAAPPRAAPACRRSLQAQGRGPAVLQDGPADVAGKHHRHAGDVRREDRRPAVPEQDGAGDQEARRGDAAQDPGGEGHDRARADRRRAVHVDEDAHDARHAAPDGRPRHRRLVEEDLPLHRVPDPHREVDAHHQAHHQDGPAEGAQPLHELEQQGLHDDGRPERDQDPAREPVQPLLRATRGTGRAGERLVRDAHEPAGSGERVDVHQHPPGGPQARRRGRDVLHVDLRDRVEVPALPGERAGVGGREAQGAQQGGDQHRQPVELVAPGAPERRRRGARLPPLRVTLPRETPHTDQGLPLLKERGAPAAHAGKPAHA
mmetsp:Transcript_107611/g.304221  ORF Transcript_107611/g.304221 Transcript_107611/m.304221 type:complete len:366 (-) Transcript_107611:86-1183(-)